MTIITVEILIKFFLCMTIINFGILIFYSLVFMFGKGLIYRLHSIWFKMPEEEISLALYKVLGIYKIIVIVFNLVPYVALRIIA